MFELFVTFALNNSKHKLTPIFKKRIPQPKPIHSISKPIPVSNPISNPISRPIINKKTSYKSALYKVLKHKNKINNKTNKNIPKKVLKDLYRFSNKIDINYIT